MAGKMSKNERNKLEKDLATLRVAVVQCEQALADDDAADKAASKSADHSTIAEIAKRDGTAAGILAAREMGRRPGQTD